MSSTSIEHPKVSRVVFLDWLRIFAFLSVLAGHEYSAAYYATMHSPTTQPLLRFVMQLLFPLIQIGGAGVVVFFLVSGYIITHVMTRETSGVFLIRRFFRIYPLYIVAVAFELAAGRAFPGWLVLLQQLSLFGDAFHAPHTLGLVEWTLRIEVLFYLFMAALKFIGFVDGRWSRAMPAVMFGSVVSLFLLAPIPGRWAWCYGYLNLYGPFLPLGAYFFLYQQGRAGAWSCAGMSVLVLFSYWILLPIWHPELIGSSFPVYGVLIFAIFWRFRALIGISAFWLAISELTYAVYLFHNWLYGLLYILVGKIVSWSLLAHAATFVFLMLVCALAVRLVERPAIRAGRWLSGRLRDRLLPAIPAQSSAA